MDYILETRNLTKKIKSENIIKGISIKIPKGETYGLFVDNNNLYVQGFNLPLDLMIQILSTVLLFVGMMIWFRKWEGKTKG